LNGSIKENDEIVHTMIGLLEKKTKEFDEFKVKKEEREAELKNLRES